MTGDNTRERNRAALGSEGQLQRSNCRGGQTKLTRLQHDVVLYRHQTNGPEPLAETIETLPG
jgi:hypothetical protein